MGTSVKEPESEENKQRLSVRLREEEETQDT